MGSYFSASEESPQEVVPGGGYKDMSYINIFKLDDLVIDILSFIPAEELLRNCRLVCKKWRDIIDGQSIWKLKCDREKRNIPKINFVTLPVHYYENIYIHDPYGRNLIENPCGEANLDNWIILRNGGDQFRVENPPAGADSVPLEVGSTSCFATSYSRCEKFQIVNLLEKGIHKEVLELQSTKIEVGEWFAARFDCASEYKLNVALLDEKFTKVDELSSIKDIALDEFDFSNREEQWIGKEWHKVTHTFENVGRARYVYFRHSGKDCQFWAGHYGSKMTGAYVRMVV